MGIVIRTMYSNQNWQARCIKPGEDPKCTCFTSQVNIDSPKKEDEVCSGNCWEKDIRVNYRWGCTPKGRTFARAYKGMEVFFVYKPFMGNYTLWGTTKVKDVDACPVQSGKTFEDGYAFIHFESFEPLPRDKWVAGLSDKQLVGEVWRQGRFRYINREQEQYLEQLIQGEGISEGALNQPTVVPKKMDTMNFELMPSIRNSLDKIALEEGRTTEEIIREAIAEWLRSRKIQ